MELIFHTGYDNEPGDLADDMVKDLYGFNDQKTNQMRMFHKKETKALENL